MPGDIPDGSDQRTHCRVPLILPASFQTPDECFDCRVTDISAGGAGLSYAADAPPDGLLGILKIGPFGSFEGTILRGSDGRGGLRFTDGEAARNHLASNLILYVEEGLADITSRDPWSSRLSLTRTDGSYEHCYVLGISLQGVKLMTHQRPPLGELVRLGRMYGRITQHLDTGVEVAFLSFVNTPG